MLKHGNLAMASPVAGIVGFLSGASMKSTGSVAYADVGKFDGAVDLA
jgi:hypothetical protein